jgi:hypothetical protein
VRTALIAARVAELAAVPGHSEDRVRVGRNAVVVLDGASGTDCGASVSEYVEVLADRLITALDEDPVTSLQRAVCGAVEGTAATLDLGPGRSPSSTVSIVRRGPDTVDALVLGDSPVYMAHRGGVDRLTDDRLARLELPSRTRLFDRLAAGGGYDERHREIARQLSSEKAPYLNRPGGYWIAEAQPRAGRNALIRSYPAQDVSWCVLLTDGTDEPASSLGIAVEDFAAADEAQLRAVLTQIHRWEADTDPEAKHLPRFKRHDDKTIAVLQFP